jgi:hypothetical protein
LVEFLANFFVRLNAIFVNGLAAGQDFFADIKVMLDFLDCAVIRE